MGHRIIQFHNIYFILRVFLIFVSRYFLANIFQVWGTGDIFFKTVACEPQKCNFFRLACDGFEKYVPSTPNLKNVWKATFLNGLKVLPKNGINNFPNYDILIFLKKKYKYIHYVSFLVKDIV